MANGLRVKNQPTDEQIRHTECIVNVISLSTALTNDTVSFIELRGVAKATVGMKMCKARQPQPCVCVREGEGDAV